MVVFIHIESEYFNISYLILILIKFRRYFYESKGSTIHRRFFRYVTKIQDSELQAFVQELAAKHKQLFDKIYNLL